ncbi:phospholipase D family protein [Salegentibacter flavus]|uniref:PLD-like domain-containing protein n=1 Tax=Salegentibacter flavus TaxID=287099 RepID=A0A1I4YH34_9FLAO|nr:phospholipase D family protein [Salegentibacter flavus]SFN37317.1 PLD-like domain-containing protein [Salegentibacter flavus]
MAQFLTTVGNSFYIEQIIINSVKSLTLVTPYLKLSRNLIERLSDAQRNGVRITLIYGKNELAQKEKKNLFSFSNIEIFFCQNLHAKCYHNESSMIITSMNLYEFSERNNREMGLLIERDRDSEIFNDTLKEIASIKNSSVLEKGFKESQEYSEESFQLHPDYNELWNFHLPSLKSSLEVKYPNHLINFSHNQIRANDFPRKGIDLVVNGRIDFLVNNRNYYDTLKENKRDEIENRLKDVRCYWNHKVINIYPEKNFDALVNKEGQKRKVVKYLEIIEKVGKCL